jgi:S-adenosylmethionine decarboxylase
MRDLAPEILRQRQLIEGFYTRELTRESLSRFLLDLAAALGLRAYGEPIVFAPASSVGKPENAGFDAFIPLIDSGIAMYVWSQQKFFSLVIYTCKAFDPRRSLDYVRESLLVAGELASKDF